MPMLKLLSKSEIDDIHAASLEVLEKAGVLIRNKPAIKLLHDNGCKVEGENVKIPRALVEEQLKKAPPEFKIYTRNGEKEYTVGGDNVIYNPGSAAIFFFDQETA